MCRLIESIRMLDGKPQHLDYHQNRMDAAFINHFNLQPELSIEEIVDCPQALRKGEVKCRIVYDKNSYEIHYANYRINHIKAFKLVQATDINYPFKFEDRKDLDKLYSQISLSCQDMMILKNGFITDSYYANLIFKKGNDLFTPSKPLLKGTMRQYLIETGQLKEMAISRESLKYFDAFSRINAMMPLGKDLWYTWDQLYF